MRHLPFVFESPSRATLLPESRIESQVMSPAPGTVIHLIPTSMSPRPTLPSGRLLTTDVEVGSQKLGSFQLSAKTASLFHKALSIDKERRKHPGEKPHFSNFTDLDTEIRMATKNLLAQSLDWETKLDCFAMLIGYVAAFVTTVDSMLSQETNFILRLLGRHPFAAVTNSVAATARFSSSIRLS